MRWKMDFSRYSYMRTQASLGGKISVLEAEVTPITVRSAVRSTRFSSFTKAISAEYLIKQYLQTSREEPVYLELWNEALAGICKHLITYTKHASLTVLAERPNGLHNDLSPKMDHLVCFMPGAIALGATGGLPLSEARKSTEWGPKQEEEIVLAKELMKTCWATYLATTTGLAPEITYFQIDKPPRKMMDVFPNSILAGGGKTKSKSKVSKQASGLGAISKPLSDDGNEWKRDIEIHSTDHHNLQRPETVESLMYLYRITGDETYRHWGWEMFKNFVKHTAVIEEDHSPPSETESASSGTSATAAPPSRIRAFTCLSDANSIPPVQRDDMESFWLAETLKYFYLLFSDREFIPLETTVFNTEAHIFPRFQMGKTLKTGWTRKAKKTKNDQVS